MAVRFFCSLWHEFEDGRQVAVRPGTLSIFTKFELGNFDRMAVVGGGRDVYFLEAYAIPLLVMW